MYNYSYPFLILKTYYCYYCYNYDYYYFSFIFLFFVKQKGKQEKSLRNIAPSRSRNSSISRVEVMYILTPLLSLTFDVKLLMWYLMWFTSQINFMLYFNHVTFKIWFIFCKSKIHASCLVFISQNKNSKILSLTFEFYFYSPFSKN